MRSQTLPSHAQSYYRTAAAVAVAVDVVDAVNSHWKADKDSLYHNWPAGDGTEHFGAAGWKLQERRRENSRCGSRA